MGGEKSDPVVYGTGGWLTMDDSALIADCEWYLERGINLYKIRVDGSRDKARLSLLRSHFGDRLKILADANQYYKTVEEAIEVSKMLHEYGVEWFEEPLFSTSIADISELSERSAVKIAHGENLSSHDTYRDLLKYTNISIYQSDIGHPGGISEFKRILSVIPSDKTLSTHLLHELSIDVSGAHRS